MQAECQSLNPACHNMDSTNGVITINLRAGKTAELDRHPNPTTTHNPNPDLVVVWYSSLARATVATQ